MSTSPVDPFGHELSLIHMKSEQTPTKLPPSPLPLSIIKKVQESKQEIRPSIPDLLRDKMKTKPVLTERKLDQQISKELTIAAQTNQNFERLEQKALNTSSTQSIRMIVQYIISDMVLKGSAVSAQSGLPILLNTSASSLEGLIPATEILKVATDILDISTGIGLIIYKTQLIETAKEEINKLKTKNPPLEPEQAARLQKLENMVNYEEKLLQEQKTEQGVRTVKNFISYLTFLFSWGLDNPLAKTMTDVAGIVFMGAGTVLEGIFFYRAHENLEAHREWSKDFKQWMREQTIVVNKIEPHHPALLEETKRNCTQILEKRKKRHDSHFGQINNLKIKLESGEIKHSVIQKRIIDIKRPGFHHFLSQLNIKEMTAVKFEVCVIEKLGAPVNSEIVLELQQLFLKRQDIEQSSELSTQEKKKYLEGINEQMKQLEESCLQGWIDHQSDDSILATYVDYHSVLDPTIKNSLAEMVKKKHKIEKSFLKMRKIQTGTKFTAATIIFGVAIALAVIAAVTNPIGAAALILTLLTVGSILLSIGLYGAGYYQSYGQKPGITAATLKGSYVKLYYYYARNALSLLKEKIGDYLESAWQDKRDRIAEVINKLPLIAKISSKKVKEIANDDSDELVRTMILKANSDFETSKLQSQKWAERASALNEELEEIAWKDFAQQAQLKVAKQQPNSSVEEQSFDTLETLNHLLANCDFDLLSPETKELIGKQFGVDIPSLQAELQKNPTAVKQMLRDFFNMHIVAFIKFVGQQKGLTA